MSDQNAPITSYRIIELSPEDWASADGPRLPGGTYLAIVSKVEDKMKEQHAQIMLTLSTPDGQKIGHDTLTFSPTAKPIAIGKLPALGIPHGARAFTGGEMLGRKVRVHFSEVSRPNNNGEMRTFLNVDINKGTHKGYEIVEQDAF